MTRTEKMIANAEAKGRMDAKVHFAPIACNGVPYPLVNHYTQKHLRAAWQRGADAAVADRQRAASGKSVSVRVDLGGRPTITPTPPTPPPPPTPHTTPN